MINSSESAPTSPRAGVSSHNMKGNGDQQQGTRLSADYHLQPVLSSSAPEREGIWHEVRRKSSERPKIVTPKTTKTTTPKSAPPKSEVGVVPIRQCNNTNRPFN